MKVPLSWLRDYIDIPPSSSQRELTDLFNNLGLVVEGVEVVGQSYEGVVNTQALPSTISPQRYSNARRLLSLRRSSADVAVHARGGHALQLLSLSSHRWSLGLL